MLSISPSGIVPWPLWSKTAESFDRPRANGVVGHPTFLAVRLAADGQLFSVTA